MLSTQLQAYPSRPFSRSPMFTLASAEAGCSSFSLYGFERASTVRNRRT
ncbi:hypothetical protein PMI34_03123 [Pseudomonas sp. GM74]|nr:hypothetical protein PMI34_03123 [Pseudomonas sp. GM74]